jgi:Zn-dependent protease/predicted transcriptional regulator
MQSAVTIFTLFGIPIRLHVSWVFILLVLTWSLSNSYFPASYPEWSGGTYWAMGLLGSMLLFSSVLVHELSHSLAALARGHRVKSITLFILGGVSQMADEPDGPGEEFWIAAAGPLSSLGLGVAFWLLFWVVGSEGNEQIRGLTFYLGFVNLVLGVFNLVPGYPLDGGRVLRSAVWKSTGSLERATTVASRVGIGVGVLMMVAGVAVAFSFAFTTGIWLVFIGWFVRSSASASASATASRARARGPVSLSGKTVADVTRQHFPSVQPGASVRDVVDSFAVRGFQQAFLVITDDGLHGIVTASDLRSVASESWKSTAISDVMTPRERLVTVAPADPLEKALVLMARSDHQQLPVVGRGRAVGLVTRADAMNALQIPEPFGRQ